MSLLTGKRAAVAVLALAASLSLAVAATPGATPETDGPVKSLRACAGLYSFGNGEKIVVGLQPGGTDLYAARLSTGDVRKLEPAGEQTYRYGPTRDKSTPVEGSIEFNAGRDGEVTSLRWSQEGGGRGPRGRRVRSEEESVTIPLAGGAAISGLLISPPGKGPFPAAVLVTRSDRYDLWQLGMELLDHGIAILAYDRPAAGNGAAACRKKDETACADEARAALSFARSHARIDPARAGVVGWGDAGRAAALAASEEPGLAFYVDIGGGASPDLDKVRVPAMGIFFQLDAHASKGTPVSFLRALGEAGASDVAVRIFPDADGGGWTVAPGSAGVTGRDPAIFETIVAWVGTHTRPKPAKTETSGE
ncbi:MAG TPA: hypothetical protein VNI57_05990 [Candidatus Saccharimonadales bacterium]|nr:hypothetical protein [Candidatus Saccharimonadales bacterium]